MELTQTYPADYLGKLTLTALEDKVIAHYKNLIREFTIEYAYSEIRPKTITGRSGDDSWTSLGWSLTVLVIILVIILRFILPETARNSLWLFSLETLTVLSLIAHGMRFVKHDGVYFYDNQNEFIFEVKVINRNKDAAQALINFILQHVQQQSNKS